MKPLAPIFILLLLCGCASPKSTPSLPAVKTVQKSLLVAPKLVGGGQAVPLIVGPPPTNSFILLPTFVFNVPSDSLTNGLLQSSTDLVTWHDRPDCYQDQTSWLVPTLPGDTLEFYRAKFEVVPPATIN